MTRRRTLDPSWFKGKKITVMGLGLFGGGEAVTRFLSRLGARITVTDLGAESRLAKALERIAGAGAELVLGRHREEDFEKADMVVASPAVPRTSQFLELARGRGIPVTSEMNLFFQACESDWMVGITGSNGKSTVTALTGEMLKASGLPARVGGNIGKPLLEEALEIGRDERVVLEISSFQLEDLDVLEASPRIGVLTNVTPNHLDRHGTMEAYARAKEGIFRHQGAGCSSILNRDDPRCRAMKTPDGSARILFSIEEDLADGIVLSGGFVERRRGGSAERLFDAASLKIPGRFNIANAMAAAAAALEAGATVEGVRSAAASFRGIPHRLELVALKLGASWYNDSIATNPESVMAALDAIKGHIVWIAGGSDKKLDYAGVCSKAAGAVSLAVLIGQTAGTLSKELSRAGFKGEVVFAPSLEQAVSEAARSCRPQGSVLLSPACASFDMFVNFEERGDRFRDLVLALPD